MSEQLSAHETLAVKTAEIAAILAAAGIDTSAYGKGSAKTLEHLATEVLCGETWLVADSETRELRREITVAAIHVLCQLLPDGTWQELYEQQQVFADGRVRTRDLPQTLSEKMKPGEDSQTAVCRALLEELGISHEVAALYEVGVSNTVTESPSYPGLMTAIEKHGYVVVLDEADVQTQYTEKQADKTTTWLWRIATSQ